MATSKALPDADIDLIAGIVGSTVQRDREVKANRAEPGIEPDAQADAQVEIPEPRLLGKAHRAAVEEGHHPPMIRQPVPHLSRELDHGEPPQGGVVCKMRPDTLEDIASDRAASAGIEPPRRRDT